jgi:hypothetical protein
MSGETHSPGSTSIASLVLESQRALQTGEALCSHAHALSNSSAQAAFDFLALEASVRWTTEAMSEQFKAGAENVIYVSCLGLILRKVACRRCSKVNYAEASYT